ncbi:carbonic anhydrase [Mycena crocata]|nr:carbonic anhydrase [Mycena crocata]
MFLHKIPRTRACSSLLEPSHHRAPLFTAARRKREQEKASAGEEPGPVPIALPPTKRLAIITCMDARINPFKQLGISEGEAHIIRNAGGMAYVFICRFCSLMKTLGRKDALRSLIISQRLLGTREIAVYHHTGCGMVTFRGSELKRLVKWASPDDVSCAEQVDAIDFLEFGDLEKSVKNDVNFLKESPLILKGTKITGWIHEIETGEVRTNLVS